jgi:hypothetical protein
MTADFSIGDLVVDTEDDDPNPAMVVSLPAARCSEWDAYRRWDGEPVTVAEDNPDYNPNAYVVVTAYQDELEETHPDYEGETALSLTDAECHIYAFPPGRLEYYHDQDEEQEAEEAEEQEAEADEQTEDEQTEEEQQELSEEMKDLRDRLEDSATVDVEWEDGQPALVVEKLGKEHRVYPDGTVTDGPLTDRLEGIVEEYLTVPA